MEMTPKRPSHIHTIETGKCVPDTTEPLGETVVHCNSVVDYEWIEHTYQPDDCEQCAKIQIMFLLYGGCPHATD